MNIVPVTYAGMVKEKTAIDIATTPKAGARRWPGLETWGDFVVERLHTFN
jgi:hypothetical protein